MRTIIIGGPRAGKSTLSRELRHQGVPTFCADPLSEVKEPEPNVIYLPEGMGLGPDMATRWVCEHWLTMPGPWCIEGQLMARVLRKWGQYIHSRHDSEMPCDRVIVLRGTHPLATVTDGQRAMGKGVMKVWREVAHHFASITETRWWGDGRQWGEGPNGEPTL